MDTSEFDVEPNKIPKPMSAPPSPRMSPQLKTYDEDEDEDDDDDDDE